MPALGAGLGDEVAAQGAGVGVAVGLDPDHQLEGVDDEVDLARPAAVEGGLRRLGRAGDGVEVEPVVAHVGQRLERGLEDLPLAVALDAGTGARRFGRLLGSLGAVVVLVGVTVCLRWVVVGWSRFCG